MATAAGAAVKVRGMEWTVERGHIERGSEGGGWIGQESGRLPSLIWLDRSMHCPFDLSGAPVPLSQSNQRAGLPLCPRRRVRARLRLCVQVSAREALEKASGETVTKNIRRLRGATWTPVLT